MPRAFSSGALSIESNDRNWIFGLCFCNTFVMAAVKVVLPWSTCPIVPMFTCGLLRSNFSLLIFSLSHPSRSSHWSHETEGTSRTCGTYLSCHALNFRDYFLSDILGRLVITLKVHGRS